MYKILKQETILPIEIINEIVEFSVQKRTPYDEVIQELRWFCILDDIEHLITRKDGRVLVVPTLRFR